MASVYDIKPAFQRLLRPLVRLLARSGVTANHVTIAAALLSVGMGAWLWLRPAECAPLLVLPAFLFGRMALNAIDGMLAREHNMKSRLGAVLNELGDVVADAALYLPFACVAGMSPLAIVIIVILSIIAEMTGVVAVQIGASRRYDGPMGKSDRALVFGLIALLLGLGVPRGAWLDVVQWTIAALALATIVNRAAHALKEPREAA